MAKFKESNYMQRVSEVSPMTYTTKARFTRFCFSIWERQKDIEKARLLQVFKKFDENGDGVLELRE